MEREIAEEMTPKPAHPEPLDRLALDAADLVAAHPPRWGDRNKQIVYEISSPAGCVHSGRIGYSRWGAMALPASVDAAAAARRVDVRADVYDYARVAPEPWAIEWHVNFADPTLFVAYSSELLAQDEWQVAEHPALGSLLEMLESRGLPAVTVENGRPTPVVVTGVERRCHLATDRNAGAGRPHGLYGGLFSDATPDAVRLATRRVDPPTISHIIAIAAPYPGVGTYSEDEIMSVLTTAFTGFRAAVLESKRAHAATSVVVHSGFWGCGAFGGNKQLMVMLQILAAEMAGVERLVLHTVDADGVGVVETARGMVSAELGPGAREIAAVVDRVSSKGFQWGVSDGN